MTGQELTSAQVLHRRRYGENSLLLELFTLTHGRIPVIARGAASARSRRRALLQPFVPLLVRWRGRGEVGTLTTVEPDGNPPRLQGRALYSAFYVNELLVRLLPRNDALPSLFLRYRKLLGELPGESMETALRRFELDLLGLLGYGIDLRRTADGVEVSAAGRYRYLQQHGLVVAEEESGDILSGATLLALADGGKTLTPSQQREALHLLRALLAPHLGERPLKSRELFRTMRSASGITENP